MTSILAITKKAGKERPGISNSVRVALKSLHIEKWSVKDFLMEFLESVSLCIQISMRWNLLEKEEAVAWMMMLKEAKCSLYGCQQVVNRKLSIHRLKLRLKVNLKIVENWTVKKIQVDMQVRNCRCCLTSKNCWPHCLLMAWFPVHGTIIAAAVSTA